MDEAVELDALGPGVVLEVLPEIHEASAYSHNAALIIDLQLSLMRTDQVFSW